MSAAWLIFWAVLTVLNVAIFVMSVRLQNEAELLRTEADALLADIRNHLGGAA